MTPSPSTNDHANADRLTALRRWSALAAGVGGVLAVGLGFWQPAAFWPVYLVAVTFVLGLGLGSLAIALLHRLTGGNWGRCVLRELTAAVGTIPIMFLLLLPIVMGAAHLYPWLDAESPTAVLNEHQEAYFSLPFWIGRTALYLIVWCGLSLFVNRAYRAMCRTADLAKWHTQPRGTAVGLIALFLAVTFAAMDWLMSREPQWTSTIYGAMTAIGFVVSGWCMAIVMRHWLEGAGPRDVVQDLGNMLLAFLLVWVYLAFSQFLIIWSGDLPHEITWYQRRTAGVWSVVGTLLLVFHFAVPFGLLLFRDVKRDLQLLAWLASGVLVMRAVDLSWTIVPASERDLTLWIVLLPTALVAVVGLWLSVFLWQWQRLTEPAPQWLETSAREARRVPPSPEVTS
jgi:hypothetical protein